ncbi:MAG: ABC transporter substrate-binding protein [Magnetococcales bacterium]|nr:ABC transporter substrate-binding protein [Magnetococcales bacterium]
MSTIRFRYASLTATVVLVFVLSLLPGLAPADSSTPAGAMASLQKTIEQIIDILKDPQYNSPEKREIRRESLRKLVYQQFNFFLMARGAVGPRWREFTPQQQQRFSDLFKMVLEDTYLAKIEGYQGEKVMFNKEILESPTITRVESLVHAKGQEYKMFYRMTPSKEGKWEVFDIIIEGVSLINNYRSQFQSILSKEGPAGLLAKMEAKFGASGTSGSSRAASTGSMDLSLDKKSGPTTGKETPATP